MIMDLYEYFPLFHLHFFLNSEMVISQMWRCMKVLTAWKSRCSARKVELVLMWV